MVRAAQAGFTLIQMMVALAIVAALSAMALPSMSQWRGNLRVREAARDAGNALTTARSEAIRTGNNHVVFFNLDAQTNPLLDAAGTPMAILVLNDGPPGSANQNCRIDAGEPIRTRPFIDGMQWGVSNATAPVATDLGAGVIASGWSFLDPGGNPANWVLFRPDGIPLAFAPDCTLGAPGSAAGAIYVNNGNRDAAVVMAPLGGIRLHVWDRSRGQWTN